MTCGQGETEVSDCGPGSGPRLGLCGPVPGIGPGPLLRALARGPEPGARGPGSWPRPEARGPGPGFGGAGGRGGVAGIPPSVVGRMSARWLGQLFQGFAGTDMIERANKILRDKERVNNARLDCAAFTKWEALVNCGLLRKYGRDAMEITESATPPADWGRCLFKPIVQPKKAGEVHESDAEDVDLDGILKTKTWESYSAQSQKLTYGQISTLVYLNQNGMLEESATTKWGKLAPVGKGLIFHETGMRVLVIAVLDRAIVGWPLSRCAIDVNELDMTITSLRVDHITSKDSRVPAHSDWVGLCLPRRGPGLRGCVLSLGPHSDGSVAFEAD